MIGARLARRFQPRHLLGTTPRWTCVGVCRHTRYHSVAVYASCHSRAFASTTHTAAVSKRPTVPDDYFAAHRESLEHPEQFWARAAEAIEWTSTAGPVLERGQQPHDYRWFPHRTLNVSDNCLDRHVRDGRGTQVAVIYDSPVTGTTESISYSELLESVSAMAAAMHRRGLRSGDRALLYMPMIPESLIAMLACARIGVTHCVVFGGFAAPELAKRITDFRPTIIVTASCGIEPKRVIPYKPLLDEAITLSGHQPETVVLVQRPQCEATLQPNRDIDYREFVSGGGRIDPVPVPATHPWFVLHTSGTTGLPKGVEHDTGGMVVVAKYNMHHLLNIQPGEALFCSSDIGWIVGHVFILYGPLLAGATTVLYEGKPIGTPDAGAFWRLIKQHNVVSLYTSPTALRAVKREDPEAKFVHQYGIGPSMGFRALFLAGERADPDTVRWAERALSVPIVDNMWQTETNGPVICNPLGLHPFPVKPGSATYPTMGYDIQILDDEGQRITEPNVQGNLAIRLPLPPGCFHTLFNNHDRWIKSYMTRFPGYYSVEDSAYRDEDGYIFVLGRVDDVMNCAGHRLSSGQLEACLTDHPSVAEAAVVGAKDAIKGQIPVGLVVLKSGATITDPALLEKQLIASVRRTVGPVASFKHVLIVQRLPKTRSGKILRNVLRALVDGEQPKIPPTIEDGSVLDELKPILQPRQSR